MSALRVSIRRWTLAGGSEDLPTLVSEAFDALATLSELAAEPAAS
jgi:hypothetical protein